MGTVLGVILVFIIVFVVFSFLIIGTDASVIPRKDKTVIERYGDSTRWYIQSLTDSVSEFIYKLTESRAHKKKRLAEETISRYAHRYLRKPFRIETPYNPSSDYDKDASLQKALEELGISKDKWLNDCNLIMRLSYIREYRDIHNNPNNNKSILDRDEGLRKSLLFFNIPEEEWIKYGPNVLGIYNIYEKLDGCKYF